MTEASTPPTQGPPVGADHVLAVGEPLTFARRPIAVAWFCVRMFAAGLVAVLVGVVVTGREPIDYRLTATIVGFDAAVTVLVLAVCGIVLARVRVRVRVSDAGIAPSRHGPPIGWDRIAYVRIVRRPFGRHLAIGIRAVGRLWQLRLAAPDGSGWRHDPSFEQQVAAIRAVASRHTVPVIGKPGPQRRWAGIVAALFVLVAVGSTALAVRRGVIWPWTPTVSAAAPACPAVQVAGLDRHWPAATRSVSRDERVVHELGVSSYCTWTSTPGRTSRFSHLDVVVQWHGQFAASSAVGNAISAFNTARHRLLLPAPVPGIGDEAYLAAGSLAVVLARRANVTVRRSPSRRCSSGPPGSSPPSAPRYSLLEVISLPRGTGCNRPTSFDEPSDTDHACRLIGVPCSSRLDTIRLVNAVPCSVRVGRGGVMPGRGGGCSGL